MEHASVGPKADIELEIDTAVIQAQLIMSVTRCMDYSMWAPAYVDGQAISFLELPAELISSISQSCADWRTIFVLKQVCKTLKEILSDRSVWAYLVETCLNPTSFGPRNCFLTRSITAYTAPELQALFVRWKKVEQGWQSVDERTFTARELNPGLSFRNCAEMLVPGGRWMIFLTMDSSASYIDLNSQNLDRIPLIPSQWPNPDAGSRVHMQFSHYDVDCASPSSGTSLRVAVVYRVRSNSGATTLPLIQIWSICSVYDTDTQAETLEADKIAECHLDSSFRNLYAYAVEGDMVLLETADRIFEQQSTYLLMNWRKASGNAEEPSCRLLKTKTKVWAAAMLDFDRAVLLRSNLRGPLTCTTYHAVPQVPLSEIHRYRHASASGEVPYGQDVVVELSGYSSAPFPTHHMSRTFHGYDDSRCRIKTLLLADELGKHFVVVYSAKNSRTGFPSIACLDIGSTNTSRSSFGVRGRAVGVFTDDSFTFKAALYPGILSNIYKRLSREQDDIQKLAEAEMFVGPQLVTARNMDIASLVEEDDAVHSFDEGMGRLMTYNRMAHRFTVLDMNI